MIGSSYDDRAFGAELRRWRKRRGRSRLEIAASTGFGISTWQRLENGERSATLLQVVVMCAALGADPADMVEAGMPK